MDSNKSWFNLGFVGKTCAKSRQFQVNGTLTELDPFSSLLLEQVDDAHVAKVCGTNLGSILVL